MRRWTIGLLLFSVDLIEVGLLLRSPDLKRVLFGPLELLIGGACMKECLLAGPGEELSLIS